MAQEFKNKYALDIGTSFVELYGPSGDMTYSIIAGMTISNKVLNEILIDVRIIDSTNVTTCYLCSDSKLSVGSTLLLAGDLQKIVLKPGDTIEIKSNEAASVDVTMAVVENDPSVSYGGIPPVAAWYGDLGLITGGATAYSSVDSFRFSNETWSYNVTPSLYTHHKYGDGASDSVTCLCIGSDTLTTHITAIEFSSLTVSDWWSTLLFGREWMGVSSNTTMFVTYGGYTGSYYKDMQFGYFDSGGTAQDFGDLDNSRYYTSGMGNEVYGICVGGYKGSHNNDINYIEYASFSNSTRWGQGRLYSYYGCATVSNETIGLIAGTLYGFTNSIDSLDLASSGDMSLWGNISDGTNKGFGGVSDGISAYFHNGETGSYGEKIDYASGGTAARLSNTTNRRAGGTPISESGNG